MRMPHEALSFLACTIASAFHASTAADEGSHAASAHHAPGEAGTSTYEAPPLAGPGHAWTFAYGANIGKAKLEAAGIHPRATLPALLPGYKLVFDPELGGTGRLGRGRFALGETAFANVLPAPQAAQGRGQAEDQEVSPVQGVVHAVTEEELRKLDASEAPIMRREKLDVEVLGRNATLAVPAWTYVRKDDGAPAPTTAAEDHSVLQTSPNLERDKGMANLASSSAVAEGEEQAPSARYARLVVCGAQEQAGLGSYAATLRHHLEHLGMPAAALDCNKPLVPLLSQGKHSNRHQRANMESAGITSSTLAGTAAHRGTKGTSSRVIRGHEFLSAT